MKEKKQAYFLKAPLVLQERKIPKWGEEGGG